MLIYYSAYPYLEVISTREGDLLDETILHKYLHIILQGTDVKFIKDEWYETQNEELIKKYFQISTRSEEVLRCLWQNREITTKGKKEGVAFWKFLVETLKIEKKDLSLYDIDLIQREKIYIFEDLDLVKPLIDFFNEHGEFSERMRFYCKFREENPTIEFEIENTVSIPAKFAKYYSSLGPDKIRSVSYKEEDIKNLLKVTDSGDEIREAIYKEFEGVSRITRPEAKEKVQKIYDSLDLKKTAKAMDLNLFYEISETDITIDKKRIKGLKLIKKK